MKKIILTVTVVLMVLVANAQSKFEVKNFGNFKLHSYTTANPLGDMCHIIEGSKQLVVLEPAAFYDNINELGEYIFNLNKPVEKVIANYHAAGFNGFDKSVFVMVEDMPEFIKGEVYKGMMENFAKSFGDAIDVSDFVPSATVKRNAKKNWAGVDFQFMPGTSTDFPAASILIGDKVYYMRYTPTTDTHLNEHQFLNQAAIDATIAELERAKASGAVAFIGGHGTEVADLSVVEFQLESLKKMKEVAVRVGAENESAL